MSDVLLSWPSPDVMERQRRRRRIGAFLVLAVVTLIAAMALVHGFDVVTRNAAIAQLATEGSPLYRTSCAACDSGFSLPLPDWRALSIGVIALAAASAGWAARRSL